jgi:hypothetical protein
MAVALDDSGYGRLTGDSRMPFLLVPRSLQVDLDYPQITAAHLVPPQRIGGRGLASQAAGLDPPRPLPGCE